MTEPNGNGEARGLALWGAAAAFFGNLLALKVLGLALGGGDTRAAIAAFLTSLCVAGAVYAKTRRDALARRQPTTLAD